MCNTRYEYICIHEETNARKHIVPESQQARRRTHPDTQTHQAQRTGTEEHGKYSRQVNVNEHTYICTSKYVRTEFRRPYFLADYSYVQVFNFVSSVPTERYGGETYPSGNTPGKQNNNKQQQEQNARISYILYVRIHPFHHSNVSLRFTRRPIR